MKYQDIARLGEEFEGEIIRIRREIHSNPETSWNEHETTELIKRELSATAFEIETFEKPGLVARIGKGRPVIALRADIDALGMEEETGLPFASQNGAMHACGHDMHTAMLIGAAKIIDSLKDDLNHEIRLIFQPAEELAGGAKMLIEKGVMDGVDRIFGIHVMHDIPVGKLSLEAGRRMASIDVWDLEIKGSGSHGAQPHLGRDAILCASAVVMNMQQIISRNLDPMESGVVTFGTIEGGDRFNIIADKVKMTGTTRSFNIDDKAMIARRFREVLEHTVEAYGLSFTLNYKDETPPLVNDSELSVTARTIATSLFGEDTITYKKPMAGGEDFAFYMDYAPGLFAFLGVCPEGGSCPPIHNPHFNPDESAMKKGAAFLAGCGLIGG